MAKYREFKRPTGNLKGQAPVAAPAQASAPPPSAAPVKVPPLFRNIDWLAMAITFVVVWIVYFLTLAPELTLQDSGELVTGSYYAGIPHPPGYPVWTIYSWLWTALVPFGNIAWRVSLGQATAGALACGLLSLIVSRGGSMLIEGIEDLKKMTGKWESGICLVAGVVAGMLVGLDGFMWSESVVVNRISVFGVPWVMMVLLCLLRWIYAPHQLRYVYLAVFVFGICITIHQSLFVSAIGIEIAIAACKPRLGRDVFLGNGVLYLAYNVILLVTGQHLFANIGGKPGMLLLFNAIGIASLVASGWLAIRTQGLLTEWKPVVIMLFVWMLGVSFYFYMPIAGMTNPPMQWGYPRTVEGFFHALSRGQYEQPNPTNIVAEPVRFLGQLGMLIEGIASEFNWVYVFVALVPFLFYRKMRQREKSWIISLSAIYFCQGVLLMILLNPTPERASSDLVKVFFNPSHMIVAGLAGYGLVLIAAYMATQYERFRRWGLLGGGIAAALAFYCLWNTTGKHYFGPAGSVGLFDLPHWIFQAFARNQYGLPIYAALLLMGMAFVFILALVAYRNRAPLAITLGLFAIMPLHPILSHWYESEQRGHMFGYWFGHDMFTPPFKAAGGQPIYPEMTKDAILFGGTDPGRFCPTYMIFCESFTPHDCQPAEDQKFDRRDVYIITQNALADSTYLSYIRAHYNRSRQIDPPFFQELLRSAKAREQNMPTNILARMVSPLDRVFTKIGDQVEKRRRTFTSWFDGKDFIDLPALRAKLRPDAKQDPLSKWLYENLSKDTQTLVTGGSDENRLRKALAADLNRLLEREQESKKRLALAQQEKRTLDEEINFGSATESLRRKQEKLGQEIASLAAYEPLFTTNRFQLVKLSPYLEKFVRENPQSHTRIRLNRLLLEEAYSGMIAKSLGGVYPDREIYTPTIPDSQRCFQEYIEDAQRRLQMNPPQLKAGEDVKVVNDRVQVSGQVAVMSINGLLTKVIFDQNPDNEFFVEESMPLDWMYPYLTPYGIIMKINRQPLPTLTEDILRKDHEFWKQYSKRMTGDIMDYDTPIKEIVDWIEKTYLRRNFQGFTGDRKFVRDDDAQKAFSKLRSAIAGVYAWRLGPQCPPEYRPKNDVEYKRILKEADFAFRQSFSFCPYSPEAVFRYVNLLAAQQRFADGLMLAETCLKFDPENKDVKFLVSQLKGAVQATRSGQTVVTSQQPQLQQWEQEFNNNPANATLVENLVQTYQQLQQPGRAAEVLDKAIAALQGRYQTNPADYATAVSIATFLSQRQRGAEAAQLMSNVVQQLEPEVKAQMTNTAKGIWLAQGYMVLRKKMEAVTLLDRMLNLPNVDTAFLISAAQIYAQLENVGQLELTISKLLKLAPNNPEAWYDLACVQIRQGKTAEAIKSLSESLTQDRKRVESQPGNRDLAAAAAQDPRFEPLKQNPEFIKLLKRK